MAHRAARCASLGVTVQRIGDLRREALALGPEAFGERFGPWALIQSPPEPVFQRIAMSLSSARTVHMAHRGRMLDRLFVMLRGFDKLGVTFLKPESNGQLFVIGRLPDSALVVSDPSVSKHHATLRWEAKRGVFVVHDEGSTNGTFVNATALGEQEYPLADGDSLGFGDVQFLYLSAQTLFAQLESMETP